MSLTIEQFNKLVTKEEFNELKKDVSGIKKGVENILEVIDVVAKAQQSNEEEKIANTAAHDRFNSDLYKVKKHLSLDDLEAVAVL